MDPPAPGKGGHSMKAKKGLKRLLSLALALCLVLAMGLSAFAADVGGAASGNDAVENDKQGVLQVRVGVKDKETNKVVDIQAGTGFLVNADNLVTNYHVVHFDSDSYAWIQENMDLNEKQADERKVIQISVYRDQAIQAKVVTESQNADLSILKLDSALQNKTFLKINTGDVKATAPCYTLGFPWIQVAVNDMNTYTSDDVTVNGGLINKKAAVNTVKYIVHNAQMPEGCSGGPVVNYAGDVIGITKGAVSGDGFQTDYMYAIDELTNIGYFASDRRQPEGKVCIYTFIPNQKRLTYSTEDYDEDIIRSRAKIERIADTWGDGNARNEALARLESINKKTASKKRGTEFMFIINDDITYNSPSDFRDADNQDRIKELNLMRKKYQSLTTELEKLRNYYTQKASTAEISKLREEILGYEKEYYQIENGIHELEKQIRNAEIKMLKK